MPDHWVIVTPSGDVPLPPTFVAEQSEVGGVDANSLLRHRGQEANQRIGDGLRTPESFKLTGVIWRDSREDDAALIAELNSIREAVRTATGLKRLVHGLTREVLPVFDGGPEPAVASDRQGGYRLELEFWPHLLEVPVPDVEVLMLDFSKPGNARNIVFV